MKKYIVSTSLFSVALLLGACGNLDEENVKPSEIKVEVNDEDGQKIKNSEAESENKKVFEEFSIGEKVHSDYNQFTFEIKQVELWDTLEGEKSSKEGYKFLALKVVASNPIENEGRINTFDGEDLFILLDEDKIQKSFINENDGLEFASVSMTDEKYFNEFMGNGIEAGEEKEGYVVFEVPENKNNFVFGIQQSNRLKPKVLNIAVDKL